MYYMYDLVDDVPRLLFKVFMIMLSILFIYFIMMAWRWCGWWPWCSHNGWCKRRTNVHVTQTWCVFTLHRWYCMSSANDSFVSWGHFNQVHLISKTRWLVLYLQASGQPDPCQNFRRFFNQICITVIQSSSLHCRLCLCPSLWTWGTSPLLMLVILAATSSATIWQELNAEPWGRDSVIPIATECALGLDIGYGLFHRYNAVYSCI